MNRFLPPQDRGIILSVFPYDFDFTPSISLMSLQNDDIRHSEPGPSKVKPSKLRVQKKKKKGKKKKAHI